MKEIILDAVKRTTKPKQCREAGLTPGIFYGDGITDTVAVQFETSELKKIIAKHGWNAKVWLRYEGNKKFGYIKEVQRHPVTSTIIHIDVFLVSQDHEVSMLIPITFEGRENLNSLILQIVKSEIDVLGQIALIPQTVVVDVSGMQVGDTITLQNFDLDKRLKINDHEDEVYGVIIPFKKLVKEESEVEAEAEAVTEG